MTPPADPRTVLRALVEGIDGAAEDVDGDLIGVQTMRARPALAAIAGKVWLDVEDAKLAESALLSMGARWEFDPEGALPVAAKAAYDAADRLAREVAALAQAEAELRAAEEGR